MRTWLAMFSVKMAAGRSTQHGLCVSARNAIQIHIAKVANFVGGDLLCHFWQPRGQLVFADSHAVI
jgi:hypothetical protein